MLTGKSLLNTLTDELTEMSLSSMAAALEEMYLSPNFPELDPLSAITRLIEPEYQQKMNKRMTNRLRSAHLLGCPREITRCVDSAEREYLPNGITQVLSALDFIENGLNVCVLGPSDSGKSYLAKALGIVACSNHRVGYHHCEQFLEELVMLKGTDYTKYQKRLKKTCGSEIFLKKA